MSVYDPQIMTVSMIHNDPQIMTVSVIIIIIIDNSYKALFFNQS